MEDLRKQVLDYMEERKIKESTFCQYARINPNTFRKWLKKEVTLQKVTTEKILIQLGKKEKLLDRCNPPQSCFTCPLPECNNERIPNKEEYAYAQIGHMKDYIDKSSQNRTYRIKLPKQERI